MQLDALKVRISTPAEPILPGRGFYQLEEDSLYVQIGPFSKRRRFFSYLESGSIRFDLDREARLIFIEVSVPRNRWQVQDALRPPGIVEAADVRWLDFREKVQEPHLVTSVDRAVLNLQYASSNSPRNYYLAEEVIVQVNARNEVASIWVTDIVDDLAGHEIAAFRKKIRGKHTPSG